MADPLLVTVGNVELIEAGEDWLTSTGVFTITASDLASAVAAQDDPNVRTPVLKFGHTDARFGSDGDFSVGRIENMHLSSDGQTLLGDYVGVPFWLAQVLPSAYPRRSIEGEWRAMSRKDQPTWDGFFLTAVALLGAYYPACATLEDLETFWKGEDPPMYDADTGEIVALSSVIIAASKEIENMPTGTTVKKARHTSVVATTQVEDVRRVWWDDIQASIGPWAWIRAMYVDPPELIIDNDDGTMFRQTFTIDGDNITFGDPEEVRIEYVNAGRVMAGARATQEAVAVYANREAATPAIVTSNPSQENSVYQITDDQIRQLGLDPAAVTEAQVSEALATRLGTGTDDPAEGEETNQPGRSPGTPEHTGTESTEDGETEPAPNTLPEGSVLVDAATLQELRAGAAAGRAAAQRQENDDRDRFLAGAVREGRFPRSRLAHYSTMYDADKEGTRSIVASLAKGLVPVAEVGTADEGDAPTGPAYPDWMKPKARATGARITGANQATGAVITHAQEG